MRDFIRRALPLLCIAVYAVASSIGIFTGGLWAALGIGLGILMFVGVWAMDGKMPLPAKHMAILTLVTLTIFAAEVPLSTHVDISSHLWLQLVSIFLPLLLLTAPRVQEIGISSALIPVAALAACMGAIALGCELESGGVVLHMAKKANASLTEYNRGMAHAVILAFPLFAGLWVMGRKRWATILVLLLLFPASLTESHTAKLALLAGALCGTAAFYRPLWVQRVMAIMSVVILGWPFYAQVLFTRAHEQIENWHSSWRHRMEIWDYLSYRIGERPFLGWGLGTTHMLDFSQPHGDWYQALKLYGAPHPHNFITELWVETGIIGLMLGWVFLLLTLCAAARMPRALQPFALGGWAASVVIAMFGFDFWTDSLWGAFALAACAFGMLQKRIEGSDHIAHI